MSELPSISFKMTQLPLSTIKIPRLPSDIIALLLLLQQGSSHNRLLDTNLNLDLYYRFVRFSTKLK